MAFELRTKGIIESANIIWLLLSPKLKSFVIEGNGPNRYYNVSIFSLSHTMASN